MCDVPGVDWGMESYKRGSHTVWDCKYHLVWVTKYAVAVSVPAHRHGTPKST